MMKKVGKRYFLLGLKGCFVGLMFVGCQNSDVNIKADLTTKAEQNKDFAGVRFTVEKGVVNLTGECPTDKSKSLVESTVKGLYAVKDVVNNINVAPVVIGTDQQLKKSVDSVLKKYAGVQAIVRDSIVTLEGKAKSNEIKKLTGAISTLQPRKLQNNLSIKQRS